MRRDAKGSRFAGLQNPTGARIEAERLGSASRLGEWAQNGLATETNFPKKILFSDEASFVVELVR